MLFGAVLHINSNHLNITTNNTTPDCVISWINYVEQFNPYIHFISGKNNVIVGNLSWIDRLEEYVILKDKQVFFSKILSPKGWTLPTIHSALNAFYTCHHWKYKILIQRIINGYLPKKKLRN